MDWNDFRSYYQRVVSSCHPIARRPAWTISGFQSERYIAKVGMCRLLPPLNKDFWLNPTVKHVRHTQPLKGTHILCGWKSPSSSWAQGENRRFCWVVGSGGAVWGYKESREGGLEWGYDTCCHLCFPSFSYHRLCLQRKAVSLRHRHTHRGISC